jgi:outer membrane protein assembly factor BamB/ABC-type phosphate/phosphonate transport system substrate-binding protein
MTHRNRDLFLGAIVLALSLAVAGCASPKASSPQQNRSAEPIVLVVMDPLSKELACACVEGYGQRDYRKLAAYLQAGLNRPVAIEFSDDLGETLAAVGKEREVIVVGDRSLVTHGAERAALKARPVCELSGVDGATTDAAIIIARANDPAKDIKDIAGRTVLVGLAEADARHATTLAALSGAELNPPAKPENRPAGTEVGLDVLDSSATPPPVAVIPGYMLRLLEGCGSIKKGDLKVIGGTTPVPFITAFLSDNIAPETQAAIRERLMSLKSDPELLKRMESRDGFNPVDAPRPPAGVSETPAPSAEDRPGAGTQSDARRDWPDWRGVSRDGRVPRLPSQLPKTVKTVWKQPASNGGLAGLSVGDGRVVIAERDLTDQFDYYRCLNADTGEPLWQIAFPASGQLDYGQAPRAAPVLHDGKAYLLGAFGSLRCVNAADGTTVWARDLPRDFQAKLPTWGMCSTPLLVDGLLIVNPGAPQASLVALDPATGKTRWTTPGAPAAYAAFICGEFGGRRQVVGYDRESLGGWDVKTGQRLWRVVPPTSGDFNVPTPVAVDGGLVVSTENNGTRLYRFDDSGRMIPETAGRYEDLAPDTSTPVFTGGRVFGAHGGLHCLDAKGGALRPVWRSDDAAIGDYASLFADDRRVLVVTARGELILLDATAAAGDAGAAIVSRVRMFDDDVQVYSHPALVGTRLYIRGDDSVTCIELGAS